VVCVGMDPHLNVLTKRQRRLRVSGILIMLGLLVEAFSLIRIHPLAFLAFMFVGGAFLVVGIGIYLLSIASPSED
jgi:predicted membrane channel-forming protein YqfA (hemolysin III family)